MARRIGIELKQIREDEAGRYFIFGAARNKERPRRLNDTLILVRKEAPMRIELTLVLNCSLEHAWRIFDDPANLPRWQPSLVRVETISGTPGQVGARTQLTYRESGRDITLVETVEERNAPATYRCRYESALMNSSICNTFTSQSSSVTIWQIVQETQFHGLLRLIGPLTRPITVRKFRQDMARLKALVEQGLGADTAAESAL